MLPVFFVERISGLRKGELAALLWSNLEVERKALLVSKWVVQGGGIKVTRPKTATYARKISIPQEAVDLLVQEQAAEEDGEFYDACHVSTGKAPEKRQIPFLQCFPLLSACGPRP